MSSSKSLAKSVIVMIAGALLAGCSSQEGVQESLPVTSSYSTATSAPQAPSLAPAPMEELSIDKNAAKKLSRSGKKNADEWFVQQMSLHKVKIPPELTIVIRDRICSDINSGFTMNDVVNKTLSPYNLTGEQSGAMIVSALYSSCYDAQLMVPKGTNNQLQGN